jgi:CubicO group peptidase (beta-lactamase class C family)
MKLKKICKLMIAFMLGSACLSVLTPDVAAVGEPWQTYTDQYFEQIIDRGEIPGAVVSIVRDGELLFSAGYGYSDREQERPNDPAQTLFRVGSVSKLFTATAAMQLVEQGEVDLHETDVFDYIDVQPETRPQFPVTVHHLLTHTNGFDEAMIAFNTNDVEQVSNTDYIRAYTPPQKREPGTETEYSNYGMALLGQVVEDVSGVPFHEYVEEQIMQPLGMHHSSFIQHENPAEAGVAQSYHGSIPFPYQYIHMEPAGSLTATAEDMARFMIAHLEQDPALLEAETYAEMHRTQQRMHEAIPGMAYGFYEGFIGPWSIIRHDGSVDAFLTNMILIQEQNSGIFVSINGVQGEETYGLIEDYVNGLADILFEGEVGQFEAVQEAIQARADTRTEPITTEKDLQAYAGTYMYNRVTERGPLSIMRLTNPTFKVEVTGDGVIEVDDLYFREERVR